MAEQDYGYFGKGATGYAHYTTAVEHTKKSGNGGGGGGNNNGCLSVIMLCVLASSLIHLITR